MKMNSLMRNRLRSRVRRSQISLNYCQKIYICYAMAVIGLESIAERYAGSNPDRSKQFHVGRGHPDEGNWFASINNGEFLDASRRDGSFSDSIAKAFITAIYSCWDEHFRHKVTKETGVQPKAVKSDLIGDLRLIRYCIVHKKSSVSDEHLRLKKLKWQIQAGPLVITEDMFETLVEQLNNLVITAEEEVVKPPTPSLHPNPDLG